MRTLPPIVSVLLCCLLASDAAAQNLTAKKKPGQEDFFETKIRPVLVKHCYECHSESSDEVEGGLLLDTREGIRRGGQSGHAVVPGELNDSLIISALRYESMEMPPDQQLPENVIADFEKWVRGGAYDPRDGKSAVIRQEIDFDKAREFWAFQPVADSEAPAVENERWVKNEIDAFVLARSEAEGIEPVRDAESQTLARRIYFDLIGLPPSPEQLDDFVKAMESDADEAIRSTVDHLLESRHFGERWGRHWLDVVRYAESTGMERNGTFTRAWRYRDYVIDAFNNDMPFDQFIHEQVSGDLLSSESPEQRARQLIATGMLALGPKSLNENKKTKFQMDVVDEQIDVVTRAFIGLTASCARCHDHKFDPIPQSEYYALAGIFTSTETHYGTAKTNGNRNPGKLLAVDGDKATPVAVSGGAAGAKEEKKYRTQLKAFEKRLTNLERQIKTAKNEKAEQAARKRVTETKDDIRRARNRLRQATQPAPTTKDGAMLVMAVTDRERIADTKLRIRGEPDEYGREIPRGFLTIASTSDVSALGSDSSGRQELAEWITDRDNPLTARVAVNRVWQHLFGKGLVSTVNNFGANGDRPTHPMLLDHLASTFVDDGWSTKKLIRRIMTSHVYRLSCNENAEALAVDPDNKLLWRMNQRRLEAEAIRDSMLVVSGQLDLNPQSGSAVQRVGEGIIGRNVRAEELAGDHVARSVYLPILRGGVPEMLKLFDFPEPSIIGGVRDVTTVPTQALYMLNNPKVIGYARKMAERVQNHSGSAEDKIRYAYRLAVSRLPDSAELERVISYLDETQRSLKESSGESDTEAEQIAWSSFCQSLFASSEFRYLN